MLEARAANNNITSYQSASVTGNGAPYSTVTNTGSNTSYPLPPIGKSHYTDVQRLQHHNTVKRNFQSEQQELQSRIAAERATNKKAVGFDSRYSRPVRKKSFTRENVRNKQSYGLNHNQQNISNNNSFDNNSISRAEELFVASFEPANRSRSQPPSLIVTQPHQETQLSSTPQVGWSSTLQPTAPSPDNMSYLSSPRGYGGYRGSYGSLNSPQAGYQQQPYYSTPSPYDAGKIIL